MSAVGNAQTWVKEQPWRTWTNQALTIARIDLRRGLFSRRAWWVYLMAFAPVALIAAHWIVDSAQRSGGYLEEDTKVLAGIFQIYYMRLGIFFACMGIFTWLFRGEVAEKSLHYQFLVPVRRQVLVIGKFLSGRLHCVRAFRDGGVQLFRADVFALRPAGLGLHLRGSRTAASLDVSAGNGARLSWIRRSVSRAQPGVQESHHSGTAGNGMGGNQPHHASDSSEAERCLLPAEFVSGTVAGRGTSGAVYRSGDTRPGSRCRVGTSMRDRSGHHLCLHANTEVRDHVQYGLDCARLPHSTFAITKLEQSQVDPSYYHARDPLHS